MEWDLGSCYYCNYYQSTWPSPPTIARVNCSKTPHPMYHCHSYLGPSLILKVQRGGFILPSVTVKVINPDRSDYKNYLIRNVHSNDMQSLNRVKTLLQEELGEKVPLQALILTWTFIGAISKYGSDSDVKEFFSILKEKPECAMVHVFIHDTVRM